MYSKFPFSMENIPRQKSFACLSLKFGCVLSALILILYSVLALAQCTAALGALSPLLSSDSLEGYATYGIVIGITISHGVTFFLTAIMLVGTLREKPHLMKPWVVWTSILLTICLLMFVFWTTMNMINHFSNTSLLIYAIDFVGLLVRFYMLMLVASYQKQLEEEKYEALMTLCSKDMWYNAA